ncbi:protein FAM24A [Mesoplodon densirostris]|uniref:protein FAM24A n=1 Tax=Mesoplodon densirostris TaxID=48708 RepID=UPI0028DC329F|nr:protein FAM24A [Mesoplodon densirostris]
MFDLKIMMTIGGGLLMTALVLIGGVTCLYFKVADTLNAAKDLVAMTITKSNQDEVAKATTSISESYSSLQCCEECRLPVDFDPLPSCFCDINDGL